MHIQTVHLFWWDQIHRGRVLWRVFWFVFPGLSRRVLMIALCSFAENEWEGNRIYGGDEDPSLFSSEMMSGLSVMKGWPRRTVSPVYGEDEQRGALYGEDEKMWSVTWSIWAVWSGGGGARAGIPIPNLYIHIYICPKAYLYSSGTDPDPVHRTNFVQKSQRKRHVSERESNNFILFYGNHKSKCLTWPLCVFYILPSRSPLDLVIYHANMGIFSYFSSCYTLKMG